MPFDYYSKVRAKEQRKESLAKYIVQTKGKMSQVNHDISFYKTCQRLEAEQDGEYIALRIFIVSHNLVVVLH